MTPRPKGDLDLNGHKAEMFDALRELFQALTLLVTLGTRALTEELATKRVRRNDR